MDELHSWLSQQHHGLRTFKIFQQKAENLSRDQPGHRALYRLLANIVGSYIEAFDALVSSNGCEGYGKLAVRHLD